MNGEVFTFFVGGKAGAGVKKAGSVAARLFSQMGRRVFEMDDYQSLIRGGHSYSVISTATRDVTSHHMQGHVVVALDKRSYDIHAGHVADGGILVYNSDQVDDGDGIGVPFTTEAKKYPKPDLRLGVGAVVALAVAIGMEKERLGNLIENEYARDVESNLNYANAVYDILYPEMGGRFAMEEGDHARPLLTGNEAIALGASAAGLDVYFAYPMTPSSSILHYLAAHDRDLGVTVVHPESEIAVINMAIGASFAGARAMVGSSGGGFALMEEAFSLAGMVEAPLLCVLSSRPGPSTGVPTYTEQGDLRFALGQGHGEFPGIAGSPGSVEEAFYLAAEMMGLVWRFQTPGILLTEKHLSESTMTVEIDLSRVEQAEPEMHGQGEYKRYLDTPSGVSPLLFPPSDKLIKWNSYEHDELGITTEKAELIAKMHEKRRRKGEALAEHMRGVRTVNVYGKGGPAIFAYGSTTMSVLEALRVGGIEATVVQPRYLEPLPVWELERYRGSKAIVVEQSCLGTFSSLLREKAGIEPTATVKRYDGRPFEPAELADAIKRES